MTTPQRLTEAQVQSLRNRITPIIQRVSSRALKAWLKTRNLPSSAPTKDDLANRITKLIAEGQLKEDNLEAALIGFEEASGKRVYVFDFEPKKGTSNSWLLKRLTALGIPAPSTRKLAGHKTKAMSPVYSTLDGNVLRVKWTEEHTSVKLNEQTNQPTFTQVEKHIVLIANLLTGEAQLRMDPPENRHSHTDVSGKMTEEAYYSAFKDRCAQLLDTTLEKTELSSVIKALVAEETPRVVRIHIDNHTNQKNLKWTVKAARLDIRDDAEWKAAYDKYGQTWAWDSQSFYWLPEPSVGHLRRELYSHLDAIEGFLKVNADCSDEEVDYAITQIRTR